MRCEDEEDREMKEEVREETGRKDFPLLLVVEILLYQMLFF